MEKITVTTQRGDKKMTRSYSLKKIGAVSLMHANMIATKKIADAFQKKYQQPAGDVIYSFS